jgi:hypothetical protein
MCDDVMDSVNPGGGPRLSGMTCGALATTLRLRLCITPEVVVYQSIVWLEGHFRQCLGTPGVESSHIPLTMREVTIVASMKAFPTVLPVVQKALPMASAVASVSTLIEGEEWDKLDLYDVPMSSVVLHLGLATT